MYIHNVLQITDIFRNNIDYHNILLQAGLYYFQIMDWYAAMFSVTIIAFMECIVLSRLYGRLIRIIFRKYKYVFASFRHIEMMLIIGWSDNGLKL